jgi:D-serine deaminase-like pyridoxal phosphate-dependent protein
MTGNQLRMAEEDLKRDAARLAQDAQRYADALLANQPPTPGAARRLAEEAANLARLEARIDGMRSIADLHRDED